MIREEIIKKASEHFVDNMLENYLLNNVTCTRLEEGFRYGAAWADENPDLDYIIKRYQTLQDEYYSSPIASQKMSEAEYIKEFWNEEE